jgi:hypothetical protein
VSLICSVLLFVFSGGVEIGGHGASLPIQCVTGGVEGRGGMGDGWGALAIGEGVRLFEGV